jgi:hypothetical protein
MSSTISNMSSSSNTPTPEPSTSTRAGSRKAHHKSRNGCLQCKRRCVSKQYLPIVFLAKLLLEKSRYDNITPVSASSYPFQAQRNSIKHTVRRSSRHLRTMQETPYSMFFHQTFLPGIGKQLLGKRNSTLGGQPP